MGSYIGYSDELAHLIEAGADMFLMPSRYEPCGLNQIYSLIYGTVPIVKSTGGLADTVHDWDELNRYGLTTGTGFSFNEHTGHALYTSVERATRNFHKDRKSTRLNSSHTDISYAVFCLKKKKKKTKKHV